MLDARPVHGSWRRLRWQTDAVLLSVLLIVPWLRVDGRHLLLIDIPGRRFHVLGLILFPGELYFLWLIVAGLALALFFFTALFGRVWCGWACPQTVLTDLFAAAARAIQGYTARGRPQRVALWRIVATHAVWIAGSVVLGFHAVACFRSPYLLLEDLRSLHPTLASGFWLAASALAWADLVLLRQSFCKYFCPYARLQSVLFDRDTLVIGYDTARGEPRGKRGRAAGDCVDCGLCVQVCPTGIDIRQGLQLECIACTQCVDACNEVMTRVHRAPDLIGYRSLCDVGPMRARWLRPRVLAYGVLLAATGLGLAVAVAVRDPLGLDVEHQRAAFAQRLSDGRVSNAYRLHLENRSAEPRSFRLRVDGAEGLELVAGVNPVRVPAAGSLASPVFVVAGRRDARPSQPFRFVVEDVSDPRRSASRRATFVRVLAVRSER